MKTLFEELVLWAADQLEILALYMGGSVAEVRANSLSDIDIGKPSRIPCKCGQDIAMDRDKALNTIRAHEDELAQHDVKSLAIFGSVARDEASSESDVDILVEFNNPVGIFEFVRLQRFLASILKCPIDMATPEALHQSMRAQILEEAIYA